MVKQGILVDSLVVLPLILSVEPAGVPGQVLRASGHMDHPSPLLQLNPRINNKDKYKKI